jgi:hypothetical protein
MYSYMAIINPCSGKPCCQTFSKSILKMKNIIRHQWLMPVCNPSYLGG